MSLDWMRFQGPDRGRTARFTSKGRVVLEHDSRASDVFANAMSVLAAVSRIDFKHGSRCERKKTRKGGQQGRGRRVAHKHLRTFGNFLCVELVRIDTIVLLRIQEGRVLKQFLARDCVSRWDVVRVRRRATLHPSFWTSFSNPLPSASGRYK